MKQKSSPMAALVVPHQNEQCVVEIQNHTPTFLPCATCLDWANPQIGVCPVSTREKDSHLAPVCSIVSDGPLTSQSFWRSPFDTRACDSWRHRRSRVTRFACSCVIDLHDSVSQLTQYFPCGQLYVSLLKILCFSVKQEINKQLLIPDEIRSVVLLAERERLRDFVISLTNLALEQFDTASPL